MIVDPIQAMRTSLLIPTSSSRQAHSTVAPIPSIVPDIPEYQDVGNRGKTALWVVFVIMVISSAVFAGMAWRVPISKRLYYVVTTLITIIASISYFAMATGHGVSYKHIRLRQSHNYVPDTYHDIYRKVFWARYIDWSLTTPLVLLDLSLLAGLSGAYILMAIIADVIMILTGLFAAFGSEGIQKWGWYAIACIAYLVVVWHLAINGRVQAKAKGSKVSSFFAAITGFTLIVWTAYPIVWGIANGSRKISVDGEIIAYAVLDILAKPVFGAWLLITHARMLETNIELGGFWSNGVACEGALRIGDGDGA
ncbi:family A G protein-coupled receptor-like protein [Lepidopterella palustris CBS 459.81]|uniref:Family A G protein-coupled receptor-like protein n=1 Tax=Lepidopterella palustris CBS 459.81 TaxID=1314670 RepID=A0A8E2E8V4_9PEZI|nr:family A G protein-coupled receptor-like protein [Lepidopterella palustris CBS 459.81]